MNSFLLIHGGSHGAWCWDSLISELERAGCSAYALDLPGHGVDRTARNGVTRKEYVNSVGQFIQKHHLKNLTLVGHSLAGTVLPEIFLENQNSITSLVYLAALVLSPGEAPIDLIPEDRRPDYFRMAELSPDNSIMVAKERARELFFSDVSESDAEHYYSRLTPQPFAVYLDRGHISPAVAEVSTRYILCAHDKTLPRALCLSCAEKLGVVVEEIEAGHDVMLSKPAELARLLISNS